MLKHGMSSTRINKIWRGMRSRCNNKKDPAYKKYGGRGIKIEWNSFEDFHKDMGKDYEKHFKENSGDTSIDREDNDWNYCKSNCKWSTKKEQAKNRGNNILYKGKCLKELSEIYGINYLTLYTRVNRGRLTIKEALIYNKK